MSDRRISVWTPRRAVAAIAVVLSFAFVASWTSLPARAGGGVQTQSSPAARQPLHTFAVRTGIVDPMNLPPATLVPVRHSRPLRVADPVAYLQRKSAMDSGAALPEIPSLVTLALTTAPAFSTNFVGLAFPDSQCGPGCEPPDTQVAAGPDNVVELTNIVARIFDKSGNIISTFNLNTFFGVGTSIFSSDPRIEYDTLSNRWLISFLILDGNDITTSHNGYFNLAVSKSSDPTAGFYTYQVETPGDFPDQPSLGFNDDKVATGGNAFSCTVSSTNPSNPNCANGDYEGNEFLVWNKSELLAGDTASFHTDFYPPGPAFVGQDASGFPIIPAKSRSSTSTLWMVSAYDTALNIWSVTGVPPTSQAVNTPATVTAFADPPSATQRGSSKTIDTGDSRLLDAVFRDGHLWASGTASCTPPGELITRSCLQYFEVLTAAETLNQDFKFGTKGAYNYYPSVDLDSSDDLITSFSQSSSTEYPSAYVDGRLLGDTKNTLGTPVVFQSGAASYSSNDPSGPPFRWGDYSGAGVDPSDQTAVWVAAEYAPSSAATPNWGTWIAQARVLSPSPTQTPTATATATSTPTATATATASATPTTSATPTATDTATATISPTPTTSASATPTTTGAATDTATATATSTATPTATATATATQTATPTATPTPPFGTLSVSGNLSFGKVKVNSPESKKLTVKNKGKFPLQVTIGTLVSPFTVKAGSGTFTLSKGKSKTVTAQFKPTAKGAAPPQILSITSDDPKHPSHNVSATGSGK